MADNIPSRILLFAPLTLAPFSVSLVLVPHQFFHPRAARIPRLLLRSFQMPDRSATHKATCPVPDVASVASTMPGVVHGVPGSWQS